MPKYDLQHGLPNFHGQRPREVKLWVRYLRSFCELAVKTLLSLVWSCLLPAIHGTASAAPGDEIYTRPGMLVRADGTRLNLYCMGSGSPLALGVSCRGARGR